MIIIYIAIILDKRSNFNSDPIKFNTLFDENFIPWYIILDTLKFELLI